MRQEISMRSHLQIAWTVPVALCVIAATAADNTMSWDELTRDFAKTVAETTISAQTFDTNGFHIGSSRNNELGGDFKPNGQQFQMLNIRAEDTFKIGFEKGRAMSTGGGLAVFHRKSGVPVLSVGDSNGDGQLDGLTYTKTDADGSAVVTVTDYEVDGQADLRINFSARTFEIWHQDRWYRVENRGGLRGVVLNGTFVELRRDKNRLVLP
jgi:hypothetical protein